MLTASESCRTLRLLSEIVFQSRVSGFARAISNGRAIPMSTILKFQISSDRQGRAQRRSYDLTRQQAAVGVADASEPNDQTKGQSAQIILFPGVRYCRRTVDGRSPIKRDWLMRDIDIDI